MNVAALIKQYFSEAMSSVSIDVFDEHTIGDVYKRVISLLTCHIEIELSVLQALSYCFYEILDNVHIHSGKPLGTIITHYDNTLHRLKILVADDGMGIQKSLSANSMYASISESDALRTSIEDKVTDGKGLGFGLYATYRLIQDTDSYFVIRSGNHQLLLQQGEISIEEADFWQGTIVYMELQTNKDINPNAIVDFRTDAEDEYNTLFIDSNDLETLW